MMAYLRLASQPLMDVTALERIINVPKRAIGVFLSRAPLKDSCVVEEEKNSSDRHRGEVWQLLGLCGAVFSRFSDFVCPLNAEIRQICDLKF